MKKIIAVALAAFALNASAQPDKDWWACQPIKSVGMAWDGSSWNTANFKLGNPFVLFSDGEGGITPESAGKAMGSSASILTCRNGPRDNTTCVDPYGYSLVFSPTESRGAISQMYGAVRTQNNKRDTLSVEVFECAKG